MWKQGEQLEAHTEIQTRDNDDFKHLNKGDHRYMLVVKLIEFANRIDVGERERQRDKSESLQTTEIKDLASRSSQMTVQWVLRMEV